MTKRVQLAGGSAELEQVLVGLERELRVDLDNDALRLHDGVKEGGYLFLNRDANDTRYQARSVELDGFKFGAQGKGILVRVGPASYKLRKLTSDSGDITYNDVRGTADDFDLRISDTVTTDHLWEGVQTFAEPIAANGGVDGETRGLHVGDVTGNVTGNLEGDANGNHTGTFTGDVDIRGHTLLTDDGQILETMLDPDILVNRGVPLGAIILWSGNVDEVPESWNLCDGTNGTPDLRERFVLGAGATHLPGASGGAFEISLSGTLAVGGSHAHVGSAEGHILTVDELPAHKHLNGVGNDISTEVYTRGTGPAASNPGHGIKGDDHACNFEGFTQEIGGSQPHTHTIDLDAGGAHSHDLTLDDISLLPPFYALAYIMKIV